MRLWPDTGVNTPVSRPVWIPCRSDPQPGPDAATIIMVDSNLQRENILPSERAKAYKMKLEAIKRRAHETI